MRNNNGLNLVEHHELWVKFQINDHSQLHTDTFPLDKVQASIKHLNPLCRNVPIS